MLEVRDLRVRYGRIEAVKGVDLTIEGGELVALVGANGAGKTSVLRALAGGIRGTGEVHYEGKPLRRVPGHRRVARGIALVPEGRGILSAMSVRDNLVMGAYPRRREARLAAELDAVYDRFPRLAERSRVAAGSLSGGEQQMLAIGRALMAKPRLLMLDEPSLGLAPLLVNQVLSIVAGLRQEGITVLLVEQNVHQALQIADRAYVLETGRVVRHGPADELLRSPELQEAFLGAQVAHHKGDAPGLRPAERGSPRSA